MTMKCHFLLTTKQQNNFITVEFNYYNTVIKINNKNVQGKVK